MSWEGKCFDDGSGRNVYYVDKDGKRSRITPDNFAPEFFADGTRRYYFKGQCIRCREESPAIFLVDELGEMAFSLNFCKSCILATTPSISKLRGNNRLIYESHLDTPKHLYIDLRPPIVRTDRDQKHIVRGKIAQHAVYMAMKQQRNIERMRAVKIRAAQHGVGIGKFVSWGFGDIFDEYFGEVNCEDRPHGYGVMFYYDKTVYVGEWKNGQRHTTDRKAIYTRPDGLQYDGFWMNNLRHGFGSLKYPDNGYYEGEFAKGYEHGQGVKFSPEGVRYEGRFRFGKKDGPGCLYLPDGKIQKRIFKEADCFQEPPLEPCEDEELDLYDLSDRHVDGNTAKFFQPHTLIYIATAAVAKVMAQHRNILPSERIFVRLQEFLKAGAAKKMLEIMYPKGSDAFIEAMPPQAFLSVPQVSLNHIPFKNLDTESLLYFTSCNTQMQTLQLVNNRLDPTSLELICKVIGSGAWPCLRHLDLSFNKLDVATMDTLLKNLLLLGNIRVLKLSGCKITANGAVLIGKFLEDSNTLVELNLSFNFIQTNGTEPLADVCCLFVSILFLFQYIYH
jgi:hypothetical protein